MIQLQRADLQSRKREISSSDTFKLRNKQEIHMMHRSSLSLNTVAVWDIYQYMMYCRISNCQLISHYELLHCVSLMSVVYNTLLCDHLYILSGWCASSRQATYHPTGLPHHQIKDYSWSCMAQLIEHGACKARVMSVIPTGDQYEREGIHSLL